MTKTIKSTDNEALKTERRANTSVYCNWTNFNFSIIYKKCEAGRGEGGFVTKLWIGEIILPPPSRQLMIQLIGYNLNQHFPVLVV